MVKLNVNIILGTISGLALSCLIGSLFTSMYLLQQENNNLNTQLTLSKKALKDTIQYGTTVPEKKEVTLGEFTMKVMELVDSPLSNIERKVTAQQLVKIADDMFETFEQRTNWIVLIAIESKFDNNAHSAAGAVGIGQIIPRFAEEFGSRCGLEGVTPKDLKNIVVNAAVSACQFKYLVEELASIPLALAAYNAGKYSTSVQDLKQLKNINKETASYISKWTYIKEQVTKTPDKAEETNGQRRPGLAK